MQDLSTKSKRKSKSELLKLSLTLFVIAGVMALLVSLVNYVTAPRIEQSNTEKTNNALESVMPDAAEFRPCEYSKPSLTSDDGKEIDVDGVWLAIKDGKTIGCCVKVSPRGYGGKIETIVGIDALGNIVNTQIIAISETSGIGTKIQDESFLSQFVGKSGYVASEDVDIISGATKSSKAYIRGINASLAVATECMEVTDVE